MGARLSKDFIPQLTGIVLAGGKSSRMGSDKAGLTWDDSDFLHKQLAVLATVCDDLIVVSNVSRIIRLPNVRIVSDNYSNCGPLGGLEAGLSAAAGNVCFVVACDMPFIDARSVQYISHAVFGFDAAAPFAQNRWHPLYATYRRTCLPVIRTMLEAGNLRVGELLASVRLRSISAEELMPFNTDLRMLQNINTPDEWESMRRAGEQ